MPLKRSGVQREMDNPMIRMENPPIRRLLLAQEPIPQTMNVAMTDFFSLKAETALITGGGSGLGLGIAQSFAQAGAKVVLVGRRERVLAAAVKTIGPAAACEAHDITQLDQAAALIKRAERHFGPITILVNNAGIHLKKAAAHTTPDEFNAVLQTH